MFKNSTESKLRYFKTPEKESDALNGALDLIFHVEENVDLSILFDDICGD